MAKKNKNKKSGKKLFLGNLDHLGGKKLMQHGAQESAQGKQSREHAVGGRGKRG